MKIQIKSVFGSVKFEGDFSSIKDTVVSAIKSGANLRGANLRGADLCGADLCGADLCGADLRGANLCGADLRDANLRDANLCGANLCGADLRDANLCGAYLRGAYLRDTDLRDADLCGANLCGADLCGANLRDAKNSEYAIAQTRILPDGDLIGWKQCCDNVIVKLKIPSSAKRSHALGRKCRAEFAEVVEIFGAKEGVSSFDSSIVYRVGETVKPLMPFCDDFQKECASGIHFFITRIEAEKYSL